ncbi:hypothetical protein TWF281_005169 [Arthrobotrys megalospora]
MTIPAIDHYSKLSKLAASLFVLEYGRMNDKRCRRALRHDDRDYAGLRKNDAVVFVQYVQYVIRFGLRIHTHDSESTARQRAEAGIRLTVGRSNTGTHLIQTNVDGSNIVQI